AGGAGALQRRHRARATAGGGAHPALSAAVGLIVRGAGDAGRAASVDWRCAGPARRRDAAAGDARGRPVDPAAPAARGTAAARPGPGIEAAGDAGAGTAVVVGDGPAGCDAAGERAG